MNILHIITHDTGRHLRCYGADVNTPNIDKFAEKGIKFTNYFCTAPQCSPSRASMFSGLMPHNNGMMGLAHRGFKLKEDIPYLPRILARNGYNTFLFGFQHEIEPDEVEKLGYQKSLRAKSYSCVDVVPLLIEFLKNNPPTPFFISVGFSETHRPFPEVEKVSQNLKIPEFLPECEEIRKDIGGLNILVERVDKYFGEILEVMKEKGLEEDTLIIFTTDHGIAFPGAKATLFDPGIGINLIMKGPGIEGGREINSLLSNIDLTPTILDYLNIKIPENIQGKSFLPVIKGEKKEIRDKIYIELTYHAAYDPMRGIRTKRYKYIRSFEIRPYYFPPNCDDGHSKDYFKKLGYYEKLRPFEFLFDLEKDPLERENLIGNPEYKEIEEELRENLIRWMKETEDPLLKGPVSLPDKAVLTPPWEYSHRKVWFKNE